MVFILALVIFAILMTFFFHYKFNVLTRKQFIYLVVSTVMLFIVSGAYTVLVDPSNATQVVIFAPLFWFCFYFLTKFTVNAIHKDDNGIIHFI